MRIEPRQSGVRSADLQLGHTLPIVTNLHFLHAISFTILNSLCFYYFLGFFSCWSFSFFSLSSWRFCFFNLFFYPLVCTKERLSTCNTYLHSCSFSKRNCSYSCTKCSTNSHRSSTLISKYQTRFYIAF